jgi:NADH:ubiquinone oxidoreductase subunit 5 (subunit L)/multisubunit Na+/H+ antiporter MnhA subunit
VDGLLFGLLSAITLLAVIVYYYYVKRLDITQKIAAQPLMKAIHTLLLNGYFVEFFIHYFAKNIIVKSVGKTINYIDTNIVDATVNGSKSFALRVKKEFAKSHSGYTSDNSGAMILGVLLLLVLILVGGVL